MNLVPTERLKELPALRKGEVLRPLDCRGSGNHTALGYRCANAGIEGCLGFVCSRCASEAGRGPHKPYTETCNVCAIAEKHGSSMKRALAYISETHPTQVKKGQAVCASTQPKAKPCRKCTRHVCSNCERAFRSHANKSAYCGELCRMAAHRESNRVYREQQRKKLLAA
jgi:hypothetical protein